MLKLLVKITKQFKYRYISIVVIKQQHFNFDSFFDCARCPAPATNIFPLALKNLQSQHKSFGIFDGGSKTKIDRKKIHSAHFNSFSPLAKNRIFITKPVERASNN